MPNEAAQIDFSKYSSQSLDFILQQASRLLDETIKGYRETNNKAYAALAIYIAITTANLYKMADLGATMKALPFAIMLAGAAIAIFTLWPALLSAKITLPGAMPTNLLIDYFEAEPKDKQESAMKKQTIIGYDAAIAGNIAIIQPRAHCVKRSAVILFAGLLVTLVCCITLCAISLY